MSKRLILILALAFVVGISFAAYAEVQNVKVSGDITAYVISRDLGFGRVIGGSVSGKDNIRRTNEFATITRVRVDSDLTDNVTAVVRLLNERYWGKENWLSANYGAAGTDGSVSDANTNIDLDLAYVALKEFLYSPLTITIGRQELHFGNDMIIGDPDTNNVANPASPFSISNGTVASPRDPDLSARKAFDAFRVTLNYDPLVIDAIYAKIDNTGTTGVANDDENLYGVNAGYDLGKKFGLKSTLVEAYYFVKEIGKKNLLTTTDRVKKADIVNTVGGRVVTKPIDNLTYQLEAAFQFGTKRPTQPIPVGTDNPDPSVSRKAWALETALTYDWKKVKYTPSTTLLYAYFSGDREIGDAASTGKGLKGSFRGWDPMFENQKFGDIANALLPQTNAHILGGVATAKPVDDVTLKGEVYGYWWAKVYPDMWVDGTGGYLATARGNDLCLLGKRFVGTEVDLTATYDYTEDVQFALMGGWFVPGQAFDKSNDATAKEIIGSMKVTF